MNADPVFALAQVAVLVKIVLTVILMDPRSLDTFTLPKSVAAHAMSLVIAALLVWLFARHGRALLFWSPLHAGVGALLVAFAVATPFAIDHTVALFGVYKRYLGLTQMLDNVLLYVSIATLFRDARSLRLLAILTAGVAIPVLAYSFAQRFGLDPFHFVQGTATISTLGNPDILGGFVSVIGISALGLAILLPGPLVSWHRIGLAVIGAGCMFVLYAAGIRSGVIALAGGLGATAVIAFRIRSDARAGRLLAIAGLGGLLLLGLLVSPYRTRLNPAVFASDLAIAGRLDLWSNAISVVRDNPVVGVGPDNFAAAWASRRGEISLKSGTVENSTHDFWLYLATSAGLIGLGAGLLLVLLGLARGLALTRDGHPAALAFVPLVAYLGQGTANVNEIGVDWILWVSLGVIAGAGMLPSARARRAATRKASAVGAFALAAAVIVSVFTIAPRLVAGEEMLTAEAYSLSGNGDTAVPAGESAVRADSFRAETWSTLGTALYRSRSYTAAVSAFTSAARRQPWAALPWTNLAAAWDSLGNVDAAFSAADQATKVDPFDLTARQLVAELAYARGDYARAAADGSKAISFGGSGVQVYFTTVSAYSRLGQLDRAEALAREGVGLFNTSQLRLEYAAILADEHKTADALAVLDALLKDEPDNAGAKSLKAAMTGQ